MRSSMMPQQQRSLHHGARQAAGGAPCSSPLLRRVPSTPRRSATRAVTTVDAGVKQRVNDAVQAVLQRVPPTKRASVEEIGVEVWQALKDTGAALGLDRVFPDRIPGHWNLEVTTDQNAFQGDVTTLARFTFAQFKPLDLKVDLSDAITQQHRPSTGLPSLYRGRFEDLAQGYVLFTHFRIVEEGAAATLAPLTGVLAAIAEWGVPGLEEGQQAASKGPHGDRLTIAFRKLRLQPTPSVAQDPALLKRWLDLMQPHNASMDPVTGMAEVSLPPNGPVGVVRYVLMDEDVQAHVGNAGSHMILKRCTPPPGTPGAALGGIV